MKARLSRLGAVTSVLLAAAVVMAAPAEARRNLGGTGPAPEICVLPGQAVVNSSGHGLGPVCVCVIAPDRSLVRAVGTKPTAPCPPGIR